jgi:hypothetical protein
MHTHGQKKEPTSAMHLQQILGTDKSNPSFTICRCVQTQQLHVYYGAELFEKVPDDREHPQYKLLVARLCNAGVAATRLQKEFGADRKTIQRWADALKGNDPEELVRVLAGRKAGRKFTVEIQAYVRMRFPKIYAEDRRGYSRTIRQEILEVFDVSLSAELLRPFLRDLRTNMDHGDSLNGEIACDLPSELILENELEDPGEQEVTTANEVSAYRKESPQSEASSNIRFVHHVGILLFSPVLIKIKELGGEFGWLLQQWLAAVLLGAVNIEQSKLLDMDSLQLLLVKTMKSRGPQRMHLATLANEQIAATLYRYNGQWATMTACTDFYYDPHTKQYTGALKILKGWCGSRHFADKALHMDFIHTVTGYPVYVAYHDNYADLRQRYRETIKKMRADLGLPDDQVLTMVLDRGIYAMETFEQFVSDAHLHVVTWEKDYKTGFWNKSNVVGKFVIERARNRAADVRYFRFEYTDERWSKNASMRLLRVRATNPNGKTIELGVLTDDLTRFGDEILRLIFTRWVQENDFKYLEKHYGINQITSYTSIAYEQLQGTLEDRQIKSGEYKALLKERSALRQKLKNELLKEHHHPHKDKQRTATILSLSQQENELTQRLSETQKETSRLDALIEDGYRRLDTNAKQVMDAIKLIARNAFYTLLIPFKKSYDNYRDDHAILRNLTHAHGLLIGTKSHLRIVLYPTAHYAPALRKIVEELLHRINLTHPELPDGTSRKIIFELGSSQGIELATENQDFGHYY